MSKMGCFAFSRYLTGVVLILICCIMTLQVAPCKISTLNSSKLLQGATFNKYFRYFFKTYFDIKLRPEEVPTSLELIF